MKKYFIFILLFTVVGFAKGQDLSDRIKNYLSNYQLPGNARVRKASLKSIDVNDDKKSIILTLGNGADEIHYTEEIVSRIYSDIKAALPDSVSSYKLSIIGDSKPIEYLIPTANKRGKAEKRKVWKRGYEDQPWVSNRSCPYTISKGLANRHISLCQSHGKYYDKAKGGWIWQRPRLFCTTEDLFSQTFVIPYLIPMLENAGAIVFTPRDHFWMSEEVIVDNDDEEFDNGVYNEMSLGDDWEESNLRGFKIDREVYHGHETPFGIGTSHEVKSAKKEKDIAMVQWIPNIPKSGRYPVYVTYQSHKNSAEDVTYTIYHTGGQTDVSVNQKMGGGTWVYLGEYEFREGMNDDGKIELSNICKKKGNIVSADAVRLGCGMGNIERGGSISGLPRWAEAAKYSSQWYGMPDSIYDTYNMEDEYRSDIYSRPKTTNELAGGSVYVPNREGRNVPFEAYMAFHTDAGYSKSDNFIGPLSICTTDWNGGDLDSGLDRYASRDLASIFFEGVSRDMKKYGFDCRALWNRNYGESRAAEVPSIIFEMLSHQNFADMRLGYDPQFKFDLCRSFYKSLLRFVCSMHNADYVVQPLPVKDFKAELNEHAKEVNLSWTPTYDELEPSASPTSYVVYTRKGKYGFDNGKVVKGTTCNISISPDTIYSFKVCALNEGGKSFPSETLSAYIAPSNTGTVLIVNGFTRLEGPAWTNTSTEQGFLLDKDPGVQYGQFAGFCGRQKNLSKEVWGSEGPEGLGYSGNELEGKVIMGNTFDYPYIHGEAIRNCGSHSFTSMSESAFLGTSSLDSYKAVDMIYGVQKEFSPSVPDKLFDFMRNDGKVIISGANLMKSSVMKSLVTNEETNDSLTTSLTLTGESGEFEIWREMNSECYSVPEPDVLRPDHECATIVRYEDGSSAAIKSESMTVMGFPFEAVKDERVRNELMKEALE